MHLAYKAGSKQPNTNIFCHSRVFRPVLPTPFEISSFLKLRKRQGELATHSTWNNKARAVNDFINNPFANNVASSAFLVIILSRKPCRPSCFRMETSSATLRRTYALRHG